MAKILVVDDEDYIRELISLYLNDEGYEVVEKSNGLEALEYAENYPIDLLVLDITMPKPDGWDLCKEIRQFTDIPILIITSKGESEDKIKGFKLGIDDYLVKPFDPVEMVLRVKALLKRYRIATSNLIKLGGIELDRRTYQVVYENGTRITIPMKEFEILYKLGSYPQQLFTRDNLIVQIWGFDFEGDERTVDVHIKRLRERFADFSLQFKIVTVRGLGYRLEVYQD
jgi:two-component system, OmpR family, response regulator